MKGEWKGQPGTVAEPPRAGPRGNRNEDECDHFLDPAAAAAAVCACVRVRVPVHYAHAALSLDGAVTASIYYLLFHTLNFPISCKGDVFLFSSENVSKCYFNRGSQPSGSSLTHGRHHLH